MTALPSIDTVVLDVLGTVVDEPGGLKRGFRRHLPGLGDARAEELVRLWHRYVDEQQREVLAGRRPYASSTVVDREAATRVAAATGIGGEEEEEAVRSLTAAALRLDPWPDSAQALGRLASRYPVVGLSNASRAALTRINAHAGLRWHQVLSAEDARGYKPHPDVYRLAIANAGRPPERLLMVSAHTWDLRGARALGMRTAYVSRPLGDPPSATDSFDLTAKDLDDLAIQLDAI